MANPIPPGQPAPDFTLYSTPDESLSLRELCGRPVILCFYPADWSPVCSDQMSLYNEILDELGQYDAQLVGISVDGAWCHSAFREARKLGFPLLADFEPKGATAKRYGVFRDEEGVCDRALFVLDAKGNVFWSYVSPLPVNPGADGILDALERMRARKQPAPMESHPS